MSAQLTNRIIGSSDSFYLELGLFDPRFFLPLASINFFLYISSILRSEPDEPKSI